MSSDSQLLVGSIGDKGLDFFDTTFYFSLNSLESFFFEKNILYTSNGHFYRIFGNVENMQTLLNW